MSSAVFEYYQKLLLAQYDVAGEFVHKPTLGTIREDFLKNLIMGRHTNIVIKSGELINTLGKHSPQCDGIFCTHIAPMDPPNSNNILLNVKYCKLVLEIKSRLDYEHLKKSNKDAGIIKSLDEKHIPLFGVFAYHLNIDRDILLERFGLKYDEDLDSYAIDESLELKYPNLDFVMTISQEEDIDYQFFLKKNIGDNQFYLFDSPVIEHLFTLVESLVS